MVLRVGRQLVRGRRLTGPGLTLADVIVAGLRLPDVTLAGLTRAGLTRRRLPLTRGR